MEKNKKVCIIASSGGHLEEVNQLNKVIEKYNIFFVVTKTTNTEKNDKFKYLIYDFDRRNIFFFTIRLIIMFFQQLNIFIKEKPDIILTTGAGLVIPICIIAKIFNKKIIYIESYARIDCPSKTAKFMYKFSDFFIVQRKSLLNFFPKAIFGGCIF